MNVFGIGIDVVEVARIASAIERHGELFLNRLFTAGERHYCASRNHAALHYAARFAAKEAVSKALGTGIGGHAGWLDLEIVNDPAGAPRLVLSGAAASFAKDHGITDIQISLTHAREYAAANAIAIAGSNSHGVIDPGS
jgi:holo-[acyl-carrier protein] synthase